MRFKASLGFLDILSRKNPGTGSFEPPMRRATECWLIIDEQDCGH